MKFKKIFFTTLLLMAVLTVSAVSAADNNVTDDVVNMNNEFNEELEIDAISASNLNEEDLVSQSQLKASNDEDIKLESNIESNILTHQATQDILKEYEDDDEYYDDYDEDEGLEPVKIKITPTKVTHKAKKYLTITIRDKYGYQIYGDVEIAIIKGNVAVDWFEKSYRGKPIKISTKNLKPRKYEVYVNIEDGEYSGYKSQKLTVKKATTKKKSSSKYKIITTKAKKRWVIKKSGHFKVKTKIWDMTAGFRAPYKYVDTWLYKNGKLVDQSKYKVKLKLNGKWTKWRTSGWGTNHHRYSVRDSVKVGGIKVIVRK